MALGDKDQWPNDYATLRRRAEAAEQLLNDQANETIQVIQKSEDRRRALEALLDWAERYRGGDETLHLEDWYAVRDTARTLAVAWVPFPEQTEGDTGEVVRLEAGEIP